MNILKVLPTPAILTAALLCHGLDHCKALPPTHREKLFYPGIGELASGMAGLNEPECQLLLLVLFVMPENDFPLLLVCHQEIPTNLAGAVPSCAG